MNPLSTHWLRVSVLLLLATPLVAFAVALSEGGIDYTLAVVFTLYMWAAVCVILALIALAGVVGRLVSRGIRALRR
jgi:hypothetical protein